LYPAGGIIKHLRFLLLPAVVLRLIVGKEIVFLKPVASYMQPGIKKRGRAAKANIILTENKSI
jgi:hypothetical protein